MDTKKGGESPKVGKTEGESSVLHNAQSKELRITELLICNPQTC